MKKILVVLMLLVMCTACASNSEVKQTIKPEDLLNAKTKDELATLLNCNSDEIKDLVDYIQIMDKYLPSDNVDEEESGVDEEGKTWVSATKAASMIDAYLLTKDNWTTFIGPVMKEIECFYYDENDQEVNEIRNEPEIGWLDGYYGDDNVCLIVRNKESNQEINFANWWDEFVEYVDGKYMVTYYDSEKQENVTKEFDYNDYEVIKAQGIVYHENIDESLFYEDELNPGDTYMLIKTNDGTIWQVGGQIGSFAYENR